MSTLTVAESVLGSTAGSKSEQYLKAVPSPLLVIDKNFNVLFANDVFAKIIGETPESVLAKKCFDLFKTGDCRTERCACSQAMKKQAD